MLYSQFPKFQEAKSSKDCCTLSCKAAGLFHVSLRAWDARGSWAWWSPLTSSLLLRTTKTPAAQCSAFSWVLRSCFCHIICSSHSNMPLHRYPSPWLLRTLIPILCPKHNPFKNQDQELTTGLSLPDNADLSCSLVFNKILMLSQEDAIQTKARRMFQRGGSMCHALASSRITLSQEEPSVDLNIQI